MKTQILALLVLCSLCRMERFGPNKPHMLFHVGERSKDALSMGWGYYLDNGTSLSEARLKYKTTKDGIYCNVLEHNGETHIRQYVNDSWYNLTSLIDYQLLNPQHWEAKISMNHSQWNGSKIGAFLYFTIENNDYLKVDQHKLTSDQHLVIKSPTNDTELTIDVVGKGRVLSHAFNIRGTHPLKVYGFVYNTSETWNSKHILDHLVGVNQVSRYPESKRNGKRELTEWQDKQVELLKGNNWYNNDYTFVMVTVDIEDSEELFVQMDKAHNFNAGFDDERFSKESKRLAQLYEGEEKAQFLQHVESNLLAGIAYYYGPLYAQNSLVKQEQTFTHSTTPSRLIFPRSFLWDDGFHMMVLVKNHQDKVLTFIEQWLNKIDLFGWIAREQIRGYEISSMMPEIQFVYQDSFQGNPPTLMLPIRYLITHSPNCQELRQLLQTHFWKIQKWYRYFKETQSHHDLTDIEEIQQDIKFRWRCKDSCKNGNFMGSGLDDYPRQDSEEISKQHVDLISWLFFFSESLQMVAEYLGETKAAEYYKDQKVFYNQTLYNEYLDHDNLFKDVVVGNSHFINRYITHLGYINLFPFLMGMIPEGSAEFLAVMDIMSNESILWSEDGIRSLSSNDTFYGVGDNYWRGAVWMPINYLILRACKVYYPESTKEFYASLRNNVVGTVESNYQESGYLYENYHEGKGNRGFPFYGWTSLVNSIILQLY